MGLFKNLFKGVSLHEVSISVLEENFGGFLVDNEKIDKGFSSPTILMVFTNYRLIFQKLNIKKNSNETLHIPYKSITSFSVNQIGKSEIAISISILEKGTILENFLKDELSIVGEIEKQLSNHIFSFSQ